MIFLTAAAVLVAVIFVHLYNLKDKDNKTLSENYNKLGAMYDQLKSDNAILQMQVEDKLRKEKPKKEMNIKKPAQVETPRSEASARRFVLFDLEATCDEPQFPRNESEIIEIAAFMYENTGTERRKLASFHTYVKPVKHPQLTQYCTNLTKITQDKVDNAPEFAEAVTKFKQWIRDNDNISESFWLVSWGHYDRQQLAAQCEEAGQRIDWLARHTSLKHEHSRIHRTRMGIGMGQALRKDGFTFDGDQHTASADAENMFKLFEKYFDKLQFISPKFIKRK